MSSGTDRFRLLLLDLPVIDTLDDLSLHTHLSKGLLYLLSRFPSKNYHTYKKKKKRGGYRHISQPSSELKAVQAWILRTILDNLNVSAPCKGFAKGSKISDNVKPHVGAKAILCLDLDNFFPSISAARIWTVYRSLGYRAFISGILTSLCTFEDHLPQGAPTSPKLANLVCWRLDRRLMGVAGKRGIMYTRYADDLSFSSLSYMQLTKAYKFICQIIEDEGFKLNNDKTRFAGPSRRRKVTGLIIHKHGFGIGREKYRKLRSMIHHLCLNQLEKVDKDQIEHIKGWLAFVNSVDKNRFELLKKYIENLKRKYPNSAVTFLNDWLAVIL
jgi:RNA-directed DNA polymerase